MYLVTDISGIDQQMISIIVLVMVKDDLTSFLIMRLCFGYGVGDIIRLTFFLL